MKTRATGCLKRMTAKKHGIQLSEETFRATFGRTSREIIRMLWGEDIDDARLRRIDDEKEAMYRGLITGMVPLLHALPSGCRFADRCPIATEECRRQDPPLREHRPNQWAACWHTDRVMDCFNA